MKITFKLDVFLFNLTTSELYNYFLPTQNSEEPKMIDFEAAKFQSNYFDTTLPKLLVFLYTNADIREKLIRG